MNYRKTALSVLALMTAAVITGCGETQENVIPKPVIVSPETIILDWQNAYQGKIDEFMKSDSYSEKKSRFDLRDITGDGIPELILSPDDDRNTRCTIYSYSKGVLSQLPDMGSDGTIPYLPLKGLLHDEYRGEGFVLGKYVAYENGDFKEVMTYSDNTASAAAGANIVHEINGQSVTLPQYDQTLSEYTGSTTFYLGRKFTFGSEAVNYAVHASESWNCVTTDKQKQALNDTLTMEMSKAGSAGILGAAFEIVDLNSDDVPEVIVSAPDGCRIYMFTGDMFDELKEAEGVYGNDGTLMLDIAKSVFYSDSKGETSYWSFLEGFSAADYQSSGSLMECGNKLLLTLDNITRDVYGVNGAPKTESSDGAAEGENAEGDAAEEGAAADDAASAGEAAPAEAEAE